jgi:hypothetical protein
MNNTVNHKFQLGVKLRDTVSGFTGIAIGRIEYLNGCWQYGIRPTLDKDGKIPDAHWIDEQQLEIVDTGLNATKPVVQRVGGCDSSHPNTKSTL